ncbi:hypothetical protein [Heyndrickxia oleronia]|jgi:pimeloyl-CoA synthetase|uniref:hypothetical protein n=1 Tax=Heyndrickxia oleronia TaxID=38875 RepID=UPI00242ED956|nr:hypothetical protein [Heyndrickxia oleronia]MCI1592472.1 hypothetical protein [Heyndrickxia oleronia]MCI1615433.1 hypothetical protein [Heyndrickxia oleronia]MCI1746287.1 hypothetical protein [Heyndrickxia oleronia]MCI1763600.1 hypothetical protein [Heyndrickxia oleronia]
MKPLKKIAFAMTERNLEKVIKAHEDRGWKRASEIKEHGYGVGCLLIFINKRERLNHASNSKSAF